MHVHQQQSQTCRLGEPLALREVKHPHKGRTSVSRSPSSEQEVLSQFSGYSEEIGHFTRDPCKPHLKSCLQSTKHASKKQEVNTHTDWEHSYRMEHAEHFPAPMEMCMDDHPTQTTERIQRKHLQDKTYEQNCLTHNTSPDFTFSHAEFPPGMENTPSFPGKQFLQGKEEFTLPDMENIPALLGNQSMQGNEKNMNTGTFTSGSTTLNRHPMLSTLTHQGEFHRTSNNWRWKVPTWWYFHASPTMLRQPHTWKLPRMYTTKKHYPPTSKWTLAIWHTDTDTERKKPTFFQNHQNSNH